VEWVALGYSVFLSGRLPSHMICHDFTKAELKQINDAYMRTVYNKKNCPYTYRNKNVFVNIKNETANKLYYDYCKDHFRGEHSDVMPYLFGTGMVVTVVSHVLGYI
jgi:hypothetical protein